MKKVLIEIKEHIAEVILNRPEKMNALDVETFNAIIEAGEKIQADASIRCVILRGAGKAFCAGMDLANFAGEPDPEILRPLQERTHGIANRWQKAVWVWRECQVPVIAAVHGVAYGGGLQIMSGADIKIVHPETRLCIMEMKWGIIPDMGGTQLWRHNVREDIIKELTWTNRVFSGDEAVQFGFASHTDQDPYAKALQLAEEIVSKNPTAIVKSKKLLSQANYLNVKDGLMLESVEQEQTIRKKNQLEAVYAQMQKRKGKFEDYRDK